MIDDVVAVTRARLIPVLALDDAASAVPVGRALLAGGLPIAEITFRTAAAADAIRSIIDSELCEEPERLLVGAGTIVSVKQVDLAVAAGARFIVSPGLSRAVVERCQEHGVAVIPGAVTATEVQFALELGIDSVKFFPSASSGGMAAINALAAPFPQVKFIPTGGVNLDNLGDYLAMSCVPAVGGSWMVRPELIRAGAFDEVQRLASEAVAVAQSAPKAV